LFAPEENWASLPPAFIAVNELDVLRDEGIAYAERMNASKAGNAIFKV
jgi:acetyl esterase/lipase